MFDRGYLRGMNYAGGGNVHDQMNMDNPEGEMSGSQIAHFNPHELALMDEIQGGKTPDPKTGLPEYFVLAQMLEQDPSLIELLAESFMQFHEQHGKHMQNPNPEMEQMAQDGRFGDTELAIIPDSLAEILDSLIGGPQLNPEDGKREYFFGALLGLLGRAIPSLIGAGSRIAGGAARAAGTLGRSSGKFLGAASRAAPKVARTLGNTAKQGFQTAVKNAPAIGRFANNSGLTGMAAQYLMDKMMPQSTPSQEPQYDDSSYGDSYDDGSSYGDSSYGGGDEGGYDGGYGYDDYEDPYR